MYFKDPLVLKLHVMSGNCVVAHCDQQMMLCLFLYCVSVSVYFRRTVHSKTQHKISFRLDRWLYIQSVCMQFVKSADFGFSSLQQRVSFTMRFSLCCQDAYARGEVFIGSRENSYTALSGLPPNIPGYHWQFGITIVTPDRKFLFTCETEEDQKDWIAALQTVINRPMLPQEYAGKLNTQLSQFITQLFYSQFLIYICVCFLSAVEAYFKHKP